MKVIKTELEGLKIIEPDVFTDDRGFFMETFNKKRYLSAGIESDFCQSNYSFSSNGTLRGMHYQYINTQAKLIQVIKGEVYDVVLDIRAGSPTFGKWFGIFLSEKNKKQLYIPKGFAHGFCVTSTDAMFTYLCDDYYNPEGESGILWSDPDVSINWPVKKPILSKKDKNYKTLKEIPENMLPEY